MSDEMEVVQESHKTYLGDSVYVEIDNGRVKLTTDNGEGATNVIWIEPEVFYAMVKWWENLFERPQPHERDSSYSSGHDEGG